VNFLHFIVRESPNVLDLRPGDICWIGHESYRPSFGPDSLVQVFRDDFRWMGAWAPQRFFLPKTRYLKAPQKVYSQDFVFLAHTGRTLRGLPNPYVAKPLLKGEATMGRRPWQFESVGEVVYFIRSHKIQAKSFTICASMGTKLQYLFE